MKLKNVITYCIVLCCLFTTVNTFAQNKRQQELEQQRMSLMKEIEKINSLLFQEKKEEKSILVAVEDLNYKIAVRQNLIRVTNQQANILTREINSNQDEITRLRKKLTLLKEEYAAMVVKSYKSKSEESKVMFLLSSTNFQQAYKRLQYIKQYADHQKKQAQLIKEQTVKLQELNTSLSKQKEEKQKLIDANRRSRQQLQKELDQQEDMVSSIKKNLRSYNAQIKTKRQEVDKIDREIERIIRDAMANSNKKAGKATTSNTFAMTPEEKELAANFTSNKGKLPWPVNQGVVKMRYGKQKSLIDKTVTINSNGVRIATNKGEKVRAVFQGTVHSIMVPKNGNNVVLVQHGNYFTVYKNLTKINVKKGDKVSTKQIIGEVNTDRVTGESLLSFVIFKDGKTQNPANWIFRM